MKLTESTAKDTIREKEVREALAIEAANIGTFELDVAPFAFTASPRFYQIFDVHPPGALSNKEIAAMIHPEDEPIRLKAIEQATKTGELFYEVRFVLPKKGIRWVRISGKVIFDQKGQPEKMVGVAVDITEDRIASDRLEQLVQERTASLEKKNEELKSSEERYHKMVAEVTDYSIILLNPDGIIENWNKGAENIQGFTEAEAIGKPFKIFYLPEDQKNELPHRLLEEARKMGRAVHEGWYAKKDGTRFWGSVTINALHNDHDEVVGFSKVMRDLTAKKITEDQQEAGSAELARRNEELRKSEERYHKMVSEVQEYAIILLDENGNVQNWNAGAEKIKGYKAKEIVGKNFEVFYPAEDKNRGLPQHLLAQARLTGKATHEGWRVRKDGTLFWGSITITALHDDNGKVIAFSKVTRDLTERKAAEDKMIKYTAELEAQNRELEQFAYVASHDLQEPLRKIQAFTDLIKRNGYNADSDKYFDKIQTSAQRMSDLIRAVLNYSRLSKDSEARSTIDLNVILSQVKADYDLLIEEKKAIITSENLPTIEGFALQISQLFSNLVANALKFSSPSPVIRIACRTVDASHVRNRPEKLADGKYFEITFADNGIGFEPEYGEQIFMMFQRLHGRQQYAGTGIGLAICKKIVELHGGFITAESELGKGAIFYIYLPLE